RRSLPALRHVLTPEEIDILKNTARDIQQSQQSVLATKLPGGSNTAQDLAGMASHGAKNPSVVGMLAAMEAAGELVGHVGSAISGPVGMVVGKAAGMVGIPVLQAMRAAGFARVDDLVTEGILYPDKFRMLMTKLPSGAFQTQFLNNAKKQIMALGAISAARSQGGRHGR
ncbi:MAG: hypothetical protein KGL35_18550, partial [Bradyrhizobium sp.]|nr:hypothetical protein [Bradyrhizobium sp.]